MRAHSAGRICERSAQLNGDPLHGVRVVRGPDLWEVLQHSRVESASARGATFPENVGEAGGQRVEDVVDAEHVGVVGRWGGRLVHAPVMVPFDVGNLGRVEDFRDSVYHEFLDFGEREVQEELVAALGAWVGSCVHNPVWVVLVERRVGVHHLGLDPDTEAEVGGGVAGFEVGDV